MRPTVHTQIPGRRRPKLRTFSLFSEESSCSYNFFARNSGAGNGCANFMGAWKKCVLSAGKPHAHKSPRFRKGGGILVFFWGGRAGSADFIFMGASWEPARPLQRSLGQKSLENVSRGLRPRDPKKSPKKSRGQSGKSPESLGKVSGECFWSIPGLFGDFLGSQGRRPRETFSRLFRHFGPGGPERPL